MENLTQDSWLKVYENLSKSEDITPRQLKSIKDVWVLKEVEDFLILGCFSEETRVLLEKNLRSEILKALSFVFPKVTDFSVSILSSSVVSSQEKIKSLDLLFADNKTSSFLNEKFTFENFIIGESNKMAHAASVYVSEKPGSPLYSVLYISGSPGLGKTHLLNAIGNNIVSVFPEKKVLYINAADYTEEYIYSLNTKSIDSFNNKYKGLDVILIDDIQFFANKEKTSEAFFHLFNHLVVKDKQIVVAGDVPPNKLMGFHKRLIQRFNEGIYQAIDSPEFEMRVAFLRAYINKNKFKYNNGENIIFSLDQISYIASMISSSIRELVGAVKNIVNVSIIYEKPITEDLIDTAIKDFILGPTKDITLEKIINAVRDYYGFSEEEIKGVSRNADLVEARHIAMYITRQLTQITLVEIGRFFKRDHSAVINGDRRIRELIIQNKLINTKVNNIIQKIKN